MCRKAKSSFITVKDFFRRIFSVDRKSSNKNTPKINLRELKPAVNKQFSRCKGVPFYLENLDELNIGIPTADSEKKKKSDLEKIFKSQRSLYKKEGISQGTEANQEVKDEVRGAMELFAKKSKKNENLPLLYLIDPVKTLKYSGIKLSEEATRYILNRSILSARDSKALFKGI